MSFQVPGLTVTYSSSNTKPLIPLASMLKGLKGDPKSLKLRIAAVALIAFTVLEFTLRAFIPKLIGIPIVILASACGLYLLFTLKTQKVKSTTSTPPTTGKIKQKPAPKPIEKVDSKPTVDPELEKYVAEFEKEEFPSYECMEYVRGSLEAVKSLGTNLNFKKTAILPPLSSISLLSYNPNAKPPFPPLEVFKQICETSVKRKIFIIDCLEDLFTHPNPGQMIKYFTFLQTQKDRLHLSEGALAMDEKMIEIWTRVSPDTVPLLVDLGLNINQASSKDSCTPLLLLLGKNVEILRRYKNEGEYIEDVEKRIIPLMEALVANGADPHKTILFEGHQINALNYTNYNFVIEAVTPKKPAKKEENV